METLIIQAITALVTAVVTASVTYFFWLKKKDVEKEEARGRKVETLERSLSSLLHKVEDLEEKACQMEQRALSEPRVRQIVSEEVSAIKEELFGVKASINTVTAILTDLRVDLGVLNYLKDANKGG